MGKLVYFFGEGKAEGNSSMKEILGGKGANLAEMTNIGLNVPPGFTISTEVCERYYQSNKQFPEELEKEVEEALKRLERAMKARFGEAQNPLLLSVRSGAAASMPGMMDTVLNLGLNPDSLKGLIQKTGNERFAWDSYRRFITMFGDVVMGIDHEKFETILNRLKQEVGVKADTDLSPSDLKALVKELLALYKEETGEEFPTDPKVQLSRAIEAVVKSWNNDRAIKYRQLYNLNHLKGTAINVQVMVFGNMGLDSATGVCFTRNPATGEDEFYGEFLYNAQGEDVVAGIRTPLPVAELAKKMPKLYEELLGIKVTLEKHYRDIQDLEFTIQEGTLYILQTRAGKRTARAAVRIAVEMVRGNLISKEEGLLRVDANTIDQLLHPSFDPKAEKKFLAKGLPASPGAASGAVVFHSIDAEERGSQGERVILVRTETSPEDIGGMDKAQGILTARGGMTSHAAVVARGMGKCCVAGCSALSVNEKEKYFQVGDVLVKEGDFVSLDGSTGEVFLGEIPTLPSEVGGELQILLEWADEFRTLGVRTNADTPHDARVARKFGAEGIGLTRTEHMFFEEGRIRSMRKMILASQKKEREKALQELLPLQREDFIGIFREMSGFPVTIRLLDPPLHEFLPQETAAVEKMAKEMGISTQQVEKKVSSLKELNPMLGHRGCRLGITYPEITEMQARAIIEAALEAREQGFDARPEIMVPLTATSQEMRICREIIIEIAERVFQERNERIPFLVGTMIETPRAAVVSESIAQWAEFFSFGTNDLTQMGFGFSRDDAGTFLPGYIERGILPKDPFQSLDCEGIGKLIEQGVKSGRSAREDLKVGICGEHGGDPASIQFCHKARLNYVSCSPFRIPVARIAAAQAALREKRSGKEEYSTA